MRIPGALDSRANDAQEDSASGYLELSASPLSLVCALIALAALTDLALRAALRLEARWDELVYHLPFAALRGGLAIPYDMNEKMKLIYQGFPPLPHLVQGILWRLTGSVNATGVVCFIAFGAFLTYCHVALRARFWLVALIALTAPLVVIHATVSYVDLFANSLLAIAISSCLYLYLFPERPPRAVLVGGLCGVVGAAWSKYQLVPIAGVVLCLLAVVALARPTPAGFGRRRGAFLVAAAGLLAAMPYLGNWIVYGNPFWPIRIPLTGDLFPYLFDAAIGGLDQRPPPLKDYGQVRLFLHSLFEINHPTHYDARPRWNIDQGNAWIAFRMGGFWAVGVVIYLASTVAMLVSFDRKRGAVASLFLLGMLGFVAVLPQSNELRYYMFLPLCWAAAIAMVFPAIRAKAPLAAPVFLVMVLGMFLYMVSENRTYYDIERRGYEQVARDWGASQWWDKLQRGKRYCAVDMMPISLLLTGPTMTEFSIADRSSEGLCPDDATVLTKTGGQHRKGDIATGGRGDDDTPAARKAREFVNESLALYTAGKYPEAIAMAAKAIELAPRYAVAYNNLCAAYNSLARWDEGIAACTKAIEFDPGLQLAINNLAHAQRMNDAPELRRARELVAEGLALYNAGKFQESIAVTAGAVALAPRLAVAHNNLCAAYNALAKWDAGIAACTRALDIDPEYQLAKNNLAFARARTGATAPKADR